MAQTETSAPVESDPEPAARSWMREEIESVMVLVRATMSLVTDRRREEERRERAWREGGARESARANLELVRP
jgi:hypothetical protein